MMINVAVYDPQPAGGTSGPIRFVTGVPSQAALDQLVHPYVVLDGPVVGIRGSTHHVVDGQVVPLNGSAPVAPSIVPPPE